MLPVDMYIGGVEHAVLHLLYSRFYTKFLYDIGVVDFDEPFHKLFNQGMITGKNGIKMSKSKGNVVSPDDLVRDYGCDSLRMYELFVGPPELDAEWDDRGIDGVNRFLKRVWNLVMDSKDADITATKEMIKERHKLIYDVTTRLESFSLNTVISAFMEHNNKLIEIAKKEGGIDKETLSTMAVLLSPFAPHVAEELWEELGHTESVFKAGWPKYDEHAMKDDEIKVPVQINGKTKAVIEISADASKEEILKELEYLKGLYHKAAVDGRSRTCFSCVYRTEPFYISAVRDANSRNLEEIITDIPEISRQISDYLNSNSPEEKEKLRFYDDKLLPLYKLYRLETVLEEIQHEKVWLNSGGFLVIQQTEAFVSIDVNSGKFTGKKKMQETYRKINLEAAKEIARQLRLRNLSGIILIDFINMENQDHQDELFHVLQKYLRKDPVKAKAVDITPLHILELTRKKVRKPVIEEIREL